MSFDELAPTRIGKKERRKVKVDLIEHTQSYREERCKISKRPRLLRAAQRGVEPESIKPFIKSTDRANRADQIEFLGPCHGHFKDISKIHQSPRLVKEMLGKK